MHRFGPEDGPLVLALHGLTGHGRRWESLAREHLPEARILAPDLRGHGRSTYEPPWRLETVADDVAALLDPAEPAVVVGHSFGGATGLFLAHRHPELVRALVLLDPALGLPAEPVLRVAEDVARHPGYADAAQARQAKLHEAWGEVDARLLDEEIAEHLVPTGDGRVGWRCGVAAMAALHGELARDVVLPAAAIPTVVVQALKVQPSYVRPALLDGLAGRLGPLLSVHQFDCDHMVTHARPAEVAALIRPLL